VTLVGACSVNGNSAHQRCCMTWAAARTAACILHSLDCRPMRCCYQFAALAAMHTSYDDLQTPRLQHMHAGLLCSHVDYSFCCHLCHLLGYNHIDCMHAIITAATTAHDAAAAAQTCLGT
jgi:hypothetical protein